MANIINSTIVSNDTTTTNVTTATSSAPAASNVATQLANKNFSPSRNGSTFNYNKVLKQIMENQKIEDLRLFFQEFKDDTFNTTTKEKAWMKSLYANPKRPKNDVNVARLRMEAFTRRDMYSELKKILIQAEARHTDKKKVLVNNERISVFTLHHPIERPFFGPLTRADILSVLYGIQNNNQATPRRGMENFILPGYAVVSPTMEDFILKTDEGEYPITGETLLDMIIAVPGEYQIVPFTQSCVFKTEYKIPSMDGYTMVIPSEITIKIKGSTNTLTFPKLRLSLPNNIYRVMVEGALYSQHPEIEDIQQYKIVSELVEKIYKVKGFVPQNLLDVECIWGHIVPLLKKVGGELEYKMIQESKVYLQLGRFLNMRGYDTLEQLYDPKFFANGFLHMLAEQAARADAAATNSQQQNEVQATDTSDNDADFDNSNFSHDIPDENDLNQF